MLRYRKGAGYAQRLVELCSDDDLPHVIVEALEHISEDLPSGLSTDVQAEGDDEPAPLLG